jgi:hypothetical protein
MSKNVIIELKKKLYQRTDVSICELCCDKQNLNHKHLLTSYDKAFFYSLYTDRNKVNQMITLPSFAYRLKWRQQQQHNGYVVF